MLSICLEKLSRTHSTLVSPFVTVHVQGLDGKEGSVESSDGQRDIHHTSSFNFHPSEDVFNFQLKGKYEIATAIHIELFDSNNLIAHDGDRNHSFGSASIQLDRWLWSTINYQKATIAIPITTSSGTTVSMLQMSLYLEDSAHSSNKVDSSVGGKGKGTVNMWKAPSFKVTLVSGRNIHNLRLGKDINASCATNSIEENNYEPSDTFVQVYTDGIKSDVSSSVAEDSGSFPNWDEVLIIPRDESRATSKTVSTHDVDNVIRIPSIRLAINSLQIGAPQHVLVGEVLLLVPPLNYTDATATKDDSFNGLKWFPLKDRSGDILVKIEHSLEMHKVTFNDDGTVVAAPSPLFHWSSLSYSRIKFKVREEDEENRAMDFVLGKLKDGKLKTLLTKCAAQNVDYSDVNNLVDAEDRFVPVDSVRRAVNQAGTEWGWNNFLGNIMSDYFLEPSNTVTTFRKIKYNLLQYEQFKFERNLLLDYAKIITFSNEFKERKHEFKALFKSKEFADISTVDKKEGATDTEAKQEEKSSEGKSAVKRPTNGKFDKIITEGEFILALKKMRCEWIYPSNFMKNLDKRMETVTSSLSWAELESVMVSLIDRKITKCASQIRGRLNRLRAQRETVFEKLLHHQYQERLQCQRKLKEVKTKMQIAKLELTRSTLAGLTFHSRTVFSVSNTQKELGAGDRGAYLVLDTIIKSCQESSTMWDDPDFIGQKSSPHALYVNKQYEIWCSKNSNSFGSILERESQESSPSPFFKINTAGDPISFPKLAGGGGGPKKIQWRRPNEIHVRRGEQVSIMPKNKVLSYPREGPSSNTHFIGSLSTLACYFPLINKIFLSYTTKGAAEYGIFVCIFNKASRWYYVLVDSRVPVDEMEKLLCSTNAEPSALWVSIIEKAYAKLHGGYDAILNIPFNQIITNCTGLPVQHFKRINPTSKTCDFITSSSSEGTLLVALHHCHSLHEGSLVCNDAPPSDSRLLQSYIPIMKEGKKNSGLIKDCPYILIDVQSFSSSSETLLRVACPYKTTNTQSWDGKWGYKGAAYLDKKDELSNLFCSVEVWRDDKLIFEAEPIGYDLNDGTFLMTLEEYCEAFTDYYSVTPSVTTQHCSIESLSCDAFVGGYNADTLNESMAAFIASPNHNQYLIQFKEDDRLTTVRVYISIQREFEYNIAPGKNRRENSVGLHVISFHESHFKLSDGVINSPSVVTPAWYTAEGEMVFAYDLDITQTYLIVPSLKDGEKDSKSQVCLKLHSTASCDIRTVQKFSHFHFSEKSRLVVDKNHPPCLMVQEADIPPKHFQCLLSGKESVASPKHVDLSLQRTIAAIKCQRRRQKSYSKRMEKIRNILTGVRTIDATVEGKDVEGGDVEDPPLSPEAVEVEVNRLKKLDNSTVSRKELKTVSPKALKSTPRNNNKISGAGKSASNESKVLSGPSSPLNNNTRGASLTMTTPEEEGAEECRVMIFEGNKTICRLTSIKKTDNQNSLFSTETIYVGNDMKVEVEELRAKTPYSLYFMLVYSPPGSIKRHVYERVLTFDELLKLVVFCLPMILTEKNNAEEFDATINSSIFKWITDGIVPKRDIMVDWVCQKFYIDTEDELRTINEVVDKADESQIFDFYNNGMMDSRERRKALRKKISLERNSRQYEKQKSHSKSRGKAGSSSSLPLLPPAASGNTTTPDKEREKERGRDDRIKIISSTKSSNQEVMKAKAPPFDSKRNERGSNQSQEGASKARREVNMKKTV